MMNKVFYIAAAVLAIIAIGGFIAYRSIQSNLNNLKYMNISDSDLSGISDGVYAGSYEVFPVSAKVNVTIENHRIRKIDLIEHKSGQGQAAEVLPAKVTEAQTLQVDSISGATYSSKVILKAIENALKNAYGASQNL